MSLPDWTTAVVADACVRFSIPLRIAPPGLRAVVAGARVSGPVRPVQHYGSVDVFLEACNAAKRGDVLVIDNVGILHEGCIGDRTAIEAANAGIAGVLVWGAHRDSAELTAIGLPSSATVRIQLDLSNSGLDATTRSPPRASATSA